VYPTAVASTGMPRSLTSNGDMKEPGRLICFRVQLRSSFTRRSLLARWNVGPTGWVRVVLCRRRRFRKWWDLSPRPATSEVLAIKSPCSRFSFPGSLAHAFCQQSPPSCFVPSQAFPSKRPAGPPLCKSRSTKTSIALVLFHHRRDRVVNSISCPLSTSRRRCSSPSSCRAGCAINSPPK
jgi:hypothetical protein